jgi:TrmH family RNA methyltransferase
LSTHVKPYTKSSPHAYTLGLFPTIELLKRKPEHAIKILFTSETTGPGYAEALFLCRTHGIPFAVEDKTVRRLSSKENCYAIGLFNKYESNLSAVDPHVVLVHVSDMGNLGTIIRTCLAFNLPNIAVIRPSADIFNPRVIRASMGALFQLHFCYFDSFAQYRERYPLHETYTFMLDGAVPIHAVSVPSRPFSLVFGNEASGLDATFKTLGTSVAIPQTQAVDSLNLSVSVGIAAFHFTRNGFLSS